MIWRLLAYLFSRPVMVDWLIARGSRTPYTHITSPDQREIYMYRYWLFNPYPEKKGPEDTRPKWLQWLPSVRLHHIMRADSDRHLHDHPWNARTIVLRGFYCERRAGEDFMRTLLSGATSTLKYREYHRIALVSPGGVWTMFWTWKYQGSWGFLVDGEKVPHGEYGDLMTLRSDAKELAP